MPDIIITPSSGKLEFIDNSAQTTRRHSFTLDHSDGLVLDAPLSAAAISAPLNVINVTVNNSNANYPFVLAQSGETGAKNLLMDGAGGTYNPSTNTATIDISGNSATTTLASNSTNLGGVAAASYVTLTDTQTLTNKTITGTFTGNLSGTSSWATNAVTATNATQLNGQAASYYTNIPARLGYTPVNQAGDTVSGNLTVNGNFSVNGSFTAFSASNIYLSSSVLTIEDNILTLNAFSPYLRYAGIEMYDSGSGTLSQFLWDGEGDYFFLTGSSVNGKIITGPDAQANLTANFIPKATAGYKLGNSLIYDNGTNVGIGTTSPAALLNIHGNYPNLIINNPNAGSGVQILLRDNGTAAGFIGHQNATSKLQFSSTNASVAHMTIDSNGNVGIGATSPSHKLHVNGGQYGTLLKGGDLGSGSDILRMLKADDAVAMLVRGDGFVGIGTTDFSYTINDNSRVVGSNTNNRLFVSGSIQLLGNNDAIVFGRNIATFLTDEELGFGWGGGWYMTDATYLRVRNNKAIYSTGEIRASQFTDSQDPNFYVYPSGASILKYEEGQNQYSFRGANRAINDWEYTGLSINPTVNSYDDGSWYIDSGATNDWSRGVLSKRRFRRVEGLTLEYESYSQTNDAGSVYCMIGFVGGNSTDFNYSQTPAHLIYQDNNTLSVYTNGANSGSDYSFDTRGAWWRFKTVLKGTGAIHYVYRNGIWNLIKEVATNNQNDYEFLRVLVSLYRQRIYLRDVKVYVAQQSYRGSNYIDNVVGSLGIGTSVPTTRLTVLAPALTVGTKNTYAAAFGNSNNTDITLGADGTYAYIQSWNSKPLYINNQGNNVLFGANVGIGTTSPATKLEVYGVVRVSESSSGGILQLTAGASAIDIASTFYGGSRRPITFTMDSERMRIAADGNVGIGTTSPGSKLDVNGTFRTAINNLTIFNDYIYVSPTENNTLNSAYFTNGIADMWINYAGYNNGNTQFRNFNVGNGKNGVIAWFDGTNKRMSINNGQTANYTLDVNGTIAYTPSVGNPILISNDATYGTSGTGRYVAVGFGGLANSANKIFAHNTGEDGIYICSATSRNINFRAGGGATDHVTIKSDGNVGIGTTAPAAKLNVVGSLVAGGVDNGSVIFYRNTNPVTIGNTDSVLYVSDRSNADWGIIVDKTGHDYALRLNVANSSTNAFGIYDGSTYNTLLYGNGGGYFLGDISIGTSSTPSARLRLASSNNSRVLWFTGATTGYTYGQIDNSGGSYYIGMSDNIGQFWGSTPYAGYHATLGTSANIPLTFATNNLIRLLLDNNGNVGIGTTSPTTKLAISDGTTIAQVNPYSGVAYFGTVNNYPMALSVNSSEKVRIQTDGNVGIGTSSPSIKLAVDGEASFGDGSKLTLIGLDINSGVTPNFIKIRTKIPFASGAADFTINIKGFRYGSAETTNLSICWHYYLSTFYSPTISSAGSYAPTVKLSAEDWDSSGTPKVCIVLVSPGYWPKLYVESMYSSAYNDAYADGWDWVDADATGTGNNLAILSYKSNFGNSFVMLSNGSVGIGTTGPTSKLHVVDAAISPALGTLRVQSTGGHSSITIDSSNTSYVPYLTFAQGGVGKFEIGTVATSSDLYINPNVQVGSTNAAIYIKKSDGNVGIGSTAPAYKLDVNGVIASSGSPIAWFSGNYNRIFEPAGNVAIYLGNNSDPANYYDNTTHYFRNRGGGSNYAIINSSGNLGIGTTSPTTKAHVYGTFTVDAAGAVVNSFTEGIRLGAASNGYSIVTFGVNAAASSGQITNQWWIGKHGGDNSFNFNSQGGGDVFRILQGGNVGIGSVTPDYKLHVMGNGYFNSTLQVNSNITLSGGGDVIINDSDGTGAFNSFMDSGIGYIRIDDGGSGNGKLNINNGLVYIQGAGNNVGIGNTSPQYKLHVTQATPSGQRAAPANTSIQVDSNTNNYISLVNTADNGTYAGLTFVDNNIGGYIVFRNYTGDVTTGSDSLIYGTFQDHIFQNSSSETINGKTETMRIKQNGNVGIGSNNPQSKLDVNGVLAFGGVAVLNTANNGNDIYANVRVIRNTSSTSADGMYINYDSAGTTAAHLRFYANAGNERMRIQANDGNVGIGTTSAGRRLDVEGIVRTRGASGSGGFEIGAATTGAAKWRIEWDSASDSLDFNWVG